MKGKILSSILALGASFAVFAHGGQHMAAAPEYFNGWVVGIDGSVQHMTGNVQDVPSTSGELTPIPLTKLPTPYFIESANENSLNTDIGDTTAGGGLFVGYGKTLNNSKFYLGGEAYARYAHNTTHTITTQDTLLFVSTSGDVNPGTADVETIDTTASIDVKSDWAYGAALKLGYLVTPKTMIYLLAGVEYSKFKIDVSHGGKDTTTVTGPTIDLGESGTISFEFDENKAAFVPGVGIETMLTDKLSLKTEYTYADYGQFDSHTHDATFNGTATVNSTPYDAEFNNHVEDKVALKRGLFSLGLAYHFNGI